MVRRMRMTYPAEFKRRAVLLAKGGDRPIRQLENELDLSANLLRYWIKQYDTYGEAAFLRPSEREGDASAASTTAEAGAGRDDASEQQLRAELAALQQQNQRLQQDNEILKKALTLFSRECA